MGGTFKVIGLTGGIGSGKSTVSKYLTEKKGVKVLDADKMAQDMLKKGSDALELIKKEFGDKVFDWRGHLKKDELAKIVFNDPEKLQILENITTKRICQTIEKIISLEKNYVNHDDFLQGKKIIACIDAPLLFEKNLDKLCDETWLVTCDYKLRLKRAMVRDNSTEAEIIKRMDNQMTEENKIHRANKIIDNSKDLKCLYDQIEALFKEFNEEGK